MTISPDIALRVPGDKATDELFPIGEAALRAGCSVRTLRYYEELRLLEPAGRSPGGSRRYSDGEIARVLRIRELQALMGLDLDEIRTVLTREDRLEALRQQWSESDDPTIQRAILLEGVALTEELRARLTDRVTAITRFVDELDGKLARYSELLAERSEDAS